MLIIGERINSTRKSIAPAVKNRDTAFIQEEARKQAEGGANYIDVNAATIGVEEEPEALSWLVQTVQEVVDLPCSLDSPNPAAIERAIAVHRGTAIINSITAEKDKFERLLKLAVEHRAKLIALCMDDSGMPSTAADRIRIGGQIVERLLGAGIPADDIFMDPLVLPIGVDSQNGLFVLETIRAWKERFPDVHISCGLTNISFGLPERRWLNRALLILCMGAGLDAVIADPTDNHLMALLLAAEAILGRDELCANYIAAARQGRLEGGK